MIFRLHDLTVYTIVLIFFLLNTLSFYQLKTIKFEQFDSHCQPVQISEDFEDGLLQGIYPDSLIINKKASWVFNLKQGSRLFSTPVKTSLYFHLNYTFFYCINRLYIEDCPTLKLFIKLKSLRL